MNSHNDNSKIERRAEVRLHVQICAWKKILKTNELFSIFICINRRQMKTAWKPVCMHYVDIIYYSIVNMEMI